MSTNAILLKVAKQGVQASTREDIVKLACAYWHEGFLPDIASVKLLPSQQQMVIGYLTEFFSTFNVVEKDRANKLVGLAKELKSHLDPVYNESNPDEIAAEWGLSDNLNEYHRDILFYQTRHYEHNK